MSYVFEGITLKAKAVWRSPSAHARNASGSQLIYGSSIYYTTLRSTDETTEMDQQLLEAMDWC
jgi:hypothetical protein